ncbi:IclR family transcriptional regulator [Spirillospora sp. CA-294931]|uniref:IclR family transcriptional regulator n=1 Tax=Spirillospora sp. CA-294931 TaxID=3240042 RepID=UPI003D9237D1
MRNRPAYAIGSVDHALRLAALLRREGPMRAGEAAERLGVSEPTAHRLLAMLVYRDFAEEGPDRRYRAGRALRTVEPSVAPVALLRRTARPHLRWLVDQTRETANLSVLTGTDIAFIGTVECEQVLRVCDREGLSLPAHLASGGRAMLAALPPRRLTALYDGFEGVDHAALRHELGLVRTRGFAINDQLTETGLTAIGMAVRDAEGAPAAAVSLALPTSRFDRGLLPAWILAISTAVRRIEGALAAG